MERSEIEKYSAEMLNMYSRRKTEFTTDVAVNQEYPDSSVGGLTVFVTAVAGLYPVQDAKVTVFRGSPEEMELVDTCMTDESGRTKSFSLSTPPKELSQQSGSQLLPYSLYGITVEKDDFVKNIHLNIPVFSGVTSLQHSDLLPFSVAGTRTEPIVYNEFSSFEL